MNFLLVYDTFFFKFLLIKWFVNHSDHWAESGDQGEICPRVGMQL